MPQDRKDVSPTTRSTSTTADLMTSSWASTTRKLLALLKVTTLPPNTATPQEKLRKVPYSPQKINSSCHLRGLWDLTIRERSSLTLVNFKFINLLTTDQVASCSSRDQISIFILYPQETIIRNKFHQDAKPFHQHPLRKRESFRDIKRCLWWSTYRNSRLTIGWHHQEDKLCLIKWCLRKTTHRKWTS